MQGIIGLISALILITVVSITVIIVGMPTVASATQFLERNGYIVIPATFASDLSTIKADVAIIKDNVTTIHTEVHEVWIHDHSEQFVSPIDAPTDLTAGAGVYVLGDFSDDIIAAGATTHSFDITAIGFGTPDQNGTYTVILYAGVADTEIGQVSFNRQGVFTASIYRDMQTEILPAGTRVRAKMKAQVAGATCVTKVYYHYN